jgi:hypothetical protein
MADERLPPELSRLGDQILAATEDKLRARERRSRLLSRLATAGVAGALLFAVLTPGPLGSADGEGDLLRLASAPALAVASPACDQPRRGTFVSSGPCSGSSLTVLRRAHAWE